ncbi:hypothetical protein BC629DRAFT_1548448, partial [Irpex lacteus]
MAFIRQAMVWGPNQTLFQLILCLHFQSPKQHIGTTKRRAATAVQGATPSLTPCQLLRLCLQFQSSKQNITKRRAATLPMPLYRTDFGTTKRCASALVQEFTIP